MSNEINKRLEELSKLLTEENLVKEGHRYFRSVTPIKSGNARRKTVIRGNDIEANYPYAQRLEKGYSKQAPDGMVQPTIEHMQEWIRKQSKG